MKRLVLTVVAVLACWVAGPSTVQAASTGTSAVTLGASANAVLQILDPTFNIVPTAFDYTNDYVEATGAAGLRVRLKSNSAGGCVLYVKCSDASPQIALADFLVKTQTAAGAGGSSATVYIAITAADQALWSSGVAQIAFTEVDTDIRIQNLFAYPDAMAAGTTSYTNNLTYTVVAQ